MEIPYLVRIVAGTLLLYIGWIVAVIAILVIVFAPGAVIDRIKRARRGDFLAGAEVPSRDTLGRECERGACYDPTHDHEDVRHRRARWVP